MGTVFLLYFITFFAVTIYGVVVLIDLGGWLNILAGLLIFCFYFIEGVITLMGFGAYLNKKKGEKTNEGIRS